jgi:hypothetical protein
MLLSKRIKNTSPGVVVLFFSLFFWMFVGRAAAEDHIILDGMHRFASGDNPAWASPEFDDSQWARVSVPGSWQSQGIKPINGLGWYRIYFRMSVSRRILMAVIRVRIAEI